MTRARFELVSFVYVQHEPTAKLRGHELSNMDWHLIHVVGGRATVSVAGQTVHAEPSRVLHVPPQTPYCFLEKDTHEALEMFNFHCHAWVDDTPLAYLATLPESFRPRALRTIHGRLRRWHAQAARGRATDRLAVSARLHTLLTHYLEQFAQPISAVGCDRDMLRLRQRLEQCPDRPFEARQWAQWCCLSVSQMNRRFRAAFGLTPRACWCQARLADLRRRLITTDASIDQIAADMAFTDRSHLTRWFTQTNGSPPAAYRRRMGRQRW